MKPTLERYAIDFNPVGDLDQDVASFLTLHHNGSTLEHTIKVKNEAKKIAELYDGSLVDKSIKAALLHDISNVVPISKMLEFANQLQIDIMEEEWKYARSVHQKLSEIMAKEIFGITDIEVLNAIRSHTTHKANASMTDKILFVADKISWELPGTHPYLAEMRKQVYDFKIDQAILLYLDVIWEQRDKLKLVHPWLIEAREELILKTNIRSGAENEK
ncbi:HD domain-containing protein [Saccharibacillus endophyticus]|uniref:HDIG domain-containing protein n=1 Tax=Saccharibacillus endophyticus TaxID=2060666 RepID=A0ABQ1ZL37_9BACL|nr:HD domain-containing protein [Saccharibacillus endophyticus]GGH68319.1 HDIG domain-containing protein [Saccharibacillus endophyticus]